MHFREPGSSHFSLIADQFDREYSLSDLLTRKDLEAVLNPLMEQFYVTVFNVGGESCFSSAREAPETVAAWIKSYFSKKSAKDRQNGYSDNDKMISGLFHEGELIGYFFIAAMETKELLENGITFIGEAMTAVLERIIRLNCKVRMTSGLQSQVVEDSYAELEAKAGALEVSERKYRLLAESLEEEVKKQTQTIQTAMVKMAQQEKLASVGQLAAGVAHEINNPMGFIISNLNTLDEYRCDLNTYFESYNNWLSNHAADSSTQNGQRLKALYDRLDLDYVLSDMEALIRESVSGAERIKKIVMDLKDFSKPGLKDAVSVDMNHLLKTILTICKTRLGEQVEIETDFRPLPLTSCFPQEINQALLNIILNAVQAMNGQGKIVISTRALEQKIQVSVKDSGCGMPQSDIPRIFDPFFTTRAVGSGTGLGLTFAYNVIQKHQGTIKVESNLGQGSTFTLNLPANSTDAFQN